MRENMGLYRGKRKIDGKWAEGAYLHLNLGRDFICDGTVWIGTHEPCKVEVIPETVGQYTGLTDIAGNRIFEGDILRTAVSGITHHTGAVLYQDGAFGLRCTDGAALFLCFVAGYYTVIGNIHDNPDLTKEGAQ